MKMTDRTQKLLPQLLACATMATNDYVRNSSIPPSLTIKGNEDLMLVRIIRCYMVVGGQFEHHSPPPPPPPPPPTTTYVLRKTLKLQYSFEDAATSHVARHLLGTPHLHVRPQSTRALMAMAHSGPSPTRPTQTAKPMPTSIEAQKCPIACNPLHMSLAVSSPCC